MPNTGTDSDDGEEGSGGGDPWYTLRRSPFGPGARPKAMAFLKDTCEGGGGRSGASHDMGAA